MTRHATADRDRLETHALQDDGSETTRELLEHLQRSSEPLVVTRGGKAAAVLLSVSEFERREEKLEMLRRLALGETEIRQGRVHPLDEVFADANALLERSGD